MTSTHSVIVFAGAKPPKMVRSVGPFDSSDDANAWRAREGLGDVPVEVELAVVMPPELPTTGVR